MLYFSPQPTAHSPQPTAHSYIDNGVIDSNPFPRCLFKLPYLSNRLCLTLLLPLLPLLPLNSSQAALSAQTVKVIQGSAPYLLLSDGTKLKNLNQLLGFEMPKQDGSRGTELIDATKDIVVAPKGMKLSDVKALVVADNRAHTVPIGNLKDDDGDIVSSLGTITAVWKANGQVVSDLIKQPLTPCDGPYTLTISSNSLKAQTRYGVPNVSDYGSATKTYRFIFGFTIDETGRTNHKITHIKPQSMQIYTRNTLYPQGYNPAVWDASKGFSVSKMNAVGKHFPTTGFDKAVFDLVASGSDQTRYCVKAPANSWVKVSGRRVTYHHDSKQGKPKTPVKLDMYYRNDNNIWSKVDSYTIPVPSKWAISPVGESYQIGYGNTLHLKDVTQFDALDACRKVGPRADNKTTSIPEGRGQTDQNRAFRQKYLYRRDELTNGKYADRTMYPEGAGNVSGWSYSSRDIGTFTGEWGYVHNYAKSPWSVEIGFWTAEAAGGKGNQFNVYANGDIWWGIPSNSFRAAICRGE